MHNPQISIIVPVYNTEAHLSAALHSIIAQSYRNWELITINDGSTDGSLNILKQYSAREERLHIIDQDNEGVSSARNAGINAATGDYIIMHDSDDIMMPDYLESMIEAQLANPHAQLIACAYRELKSPLDVGVYRAAVLDNRADEGLISDGFFISTYSTESSCVKLYHRSIIEEQQLRFRTDMIYAEDFEFTRAYIKHCQAAYYIQRPLMSYIIHSNSAMAKINKGEAALHQYIAAVTCFAALCQSFPDSISTSNKQAYCAAMFIHGCKALQTLQRINKENSLGLKLTQTLQLRASLAGILVKAGLIRGSKVFLRCLKRGLVF